jgi:ring-1,2-phenylacetyl-CoA epoxidase subunit PaaC
MNTNSPLLDATLQLADNALILGQRLAEWTGHGPVLEQDIALSNLALDQIGLARMLYQYAAEQKGDGTTEDDLAYLRLEQQYKNILLVEQPNGHWGCTILRQFFYDAWHLPFYQALMQSPDERLAAIAAKTVKEATYHLRFSTDWTVRLGDGTPESHEKMQSALDELWAFIGEMALPSDAEKALIEAGIWPDSEPLSVNFRQKVADVLSQATLVPPANNWAQTGGKTGRHTEHLGFLLTELQYMQRAYPGMQW